jgi:hypothetical protein
MNAETILIDAIVVAGIIATLMGTMTVAALLRVARAGGIRRPPAFSMPGVADRDRILRARLRARYGGQSAGVRIAVDRPLATAASILAANDHQPAGLEEAALSADPAKPMVAA